MSVEQKAGAGIAVGIADVARLSGVSKSTVSKVLHSSRRYNISESMRARVTRAAARLGYHPSWRGQLLASGKTLTIGLLYARTSPLPGDTYERTVASAAEVLLPRGYHLLHMPLIGGEAQWKSLIQAQRIDGCLVIAPMEAALGSYLCESETRAVLVNVETDLPITQVHADDAGGAAALVNHLLDLGHQRIVFCDAGARATDRAMAMRVQAFNSAMQAGLNSTAIVSGSAEEVLQSCTRGSRSPATAVIAGDLSVAIDLLHQFWRAGIKVPADVSLATFGDAYPAEKATPPLTALRVPAEQIGREAATILLDQIEGKQSSLPRKIVARETLIVRESTAAPSSTQNTNNKTKGEQK